MRHVPFLDRERPASECWSCGFAPLPGGPHCGADSTWHGFVLDDDGERIAAMMSSCDGHRRFMALAAHFVHPMVHPCAIPGSRFIWPDNYCFTDCDPAEELLAEAELVTTGS